MCFWHFKFEIMININSCVILSKPQHEITSTRNKRNLFMDGNEVCLLFSCTVSSWFRSWNFYKLVIHLLLKQSLWFHSSRRVGLASSNFGSEEFYKLVVHLLLKQSLWFHSSRRIELAPSNLFSQSLQCFQI